jgi:glycosyltransferase involved in cell wall biosynthesis
MKVAYLSEGVPYPPTIGAQQRRFHLLLAYAEAGHRVSLFALCRGPEEERAAGSLRDLCSDITLIPFASTVGARAAGWPAWRRRLGALTDSLPHTVHRYSSESMRAALALRRPEFDVLHVSRLASVPHLGALGHQGIDRQVLVLDLDDLESSARKRELATSSGTGVGARLFATLDRARLASFEKRSLPSFDAILVCSETDRARLPYSGVEVIPNGIELPARPGDPGGGDDHTLLFVGFMDYGPNADAVQFFAEQILPSVRKALPRARLVAVGRTSNPRIQRLHDGVAVSVVGEVPDLAPYYRSAGVVVVPLRAGSGTRIKILEAFAWQRPVVSTSIGVEGIPARPGEEIVVQDAPDAFAAECVDLLKNPKRRAALAARGRRLAERFQWGAIRPRLAELVARRSERHMPASTV